MATLSTGPRINARTLPRIHDEVKKHTTKLTRDGIIFEGRVLSAEALVSALLSTYLSLDYESQKKLIVPSLKELEEELHTS